MDTQSINALQEAAALYGRGDLSRAERICRQLLHRYPDAVDPANLLSLIRKRQGNLAEAERLMRQCLAADPARADIYANLGNLLIAGGRLAEAEQAYGMALSIDREFRPARLGLARLLRDAGRYAEARTEAQKLIAADADDAEAWNVVGSACRAGGDFEDAEAAFRRALELNPAYGVARHNLGSLLAQCGRSEAAIREFEAAAATGIDGPDIRFNRASALIDLSRFDEAESLLLETLAAAPRAARAHTLLARLRYMRGREDFADEYERAVAANPDDVALRTGYSRALRGAALFDRARETMEEAIARRPGESRLKAELAAILLDVGEFAESLETARQVLEENPRAPGIDEIMIDALTCLGRADEARELIEIARRRDPLNQWYIAMEATVARLQRDPLYERLYDFDRFVQTFDLPPPAGWSSSDAFNRDLAAALIERHRFEAEPLDQSIRHGTQTARGLLGDPDPVIRAFLASLDAPIREYRERIGQDAEHPLTIRNRGEVRLTGCWSVRLKRGGFHVNHVHSEGWLSSAYYVELPPDVQDDMKKSGWIKFGEPRFPVPGATPERFVRPQVGRLVLFPSYMWHGTTPIEGDAPRMTVAFDAVPRRAPAAT